MFEGQWHIRVTIRNHRAMTMHMMTCPRRWTPKKPLFPSHVRSLVFYSRPHNPTSTMFPPPIGMQLSASSSSSQTGHLIALLQILRWPDFDLPEPGSGVREGRIILIRVGVSDWPRVSHFTICREEWILTTQCSFSCVVQWRNGIRLTILFTLKASHQFSVRFWSVYLSVSMFLAGMRYFWAGTV